MSRRILAAVVVCVLCHTSTAPAWLWVIPDDSLGDPVAGLAGKWLDQGDSPQRPIRGYMINSSGYYYFAGQTADLNRFLVRLDRAAESDEVRSWYSNVSRQVVIHAGAGHVRIPGSSGNATGQRAQWKLGLVRSSDLAPDGTGVVRSLKVEVHVWIDDTIRLEDLTVPDTFAVASGGEIERFVREHRAPTAP